MFIYVAADSPIQTISHCLQEQPLEASFQKHFHENYELLLIINGDVHYNIDGACYRLNRYDLLLIPASTYHFLIPISNQPYESYVINISSNFVNSDRLRSLFSSPQILNIANDAVLIRIFQLFDHYYDIYTPVDFADASNHLLHELVLYVSYKTNIGIIAPPTPHCHPLISRITSYIANNLQSELSAETIAKQLNFSKSYVQNAFSAAMGIGIRQYINQKKIYAAHQDILRGLSPNAAASKYGYLDYSSFYRQYKKAFGHSPKNSSY